MKSGCVLETLLREYFPQGSDSERELLLRFSRELLKWNRTYNLTSITRAEEVGEKHLLDSLSLLKHVPSSGRLLDVGSGAGFPAIPVAICRPSLNVYTVDSVGKKILFQNHVKRTLDLPNLFPRQGRVESLLEQGGEDSVFDLICSRAFSSLPDFLRLTRGLLKPGGVALAMRGPEGKSETSVLGEMIIEFGYEVMQVEELTLPLSGSGRTILALRYRGFRTK